MQQLLLSLFIFQLASPEKEFLCRDVLREAVVDHFASGADVAVVAQGGFDKGEITLHFLDAATDFYYDAFASGYRLSVSHGKAGGLAGGLELAVDEPSAHFVHQRGLDASVEGFQPALEVVVRIPVANDVVAIFVKLHFQAKRIVGATGKAVVSLFFQSDVWVSDLFHIRCVLRFCQR